MSLTEIRNAVADLYDDHSDGLCSNPEFYASLAELADQVPGIAEPVAAIRAEKGYSHVRNEKIAALLTAYLVRTATAPATVTVKPIQPATPPAATPPQAADVWGKAFAQAADRQADGPAGGRQPAGDSELWKQAFSSATAR